MNKAKRRGTVPDADSRNKRLNVYETLPDSAREYNDATTCGITVIDLDTDSDEVTTSNQTRKTPKRKPGNTLSPQQRAEIVKSLEAGLSYRDLMVQYNVSARTICRIKQKKLSLPAGMKPKSKSPKTTSIISEFKVNQDSTLDEALFAWFLQRRSAGEPVSGLILHKKSLELCKKLGIVTSLFRVSNGWLDEFKKRHGIEQLSHHSDNLSLGNTSVQEFVKSLADVIEQNKYQFSEIYNVDESGLYWNSLPTKTRIKVPANTNTKAKLTVVFCANASGTHRIPLVIIGPSDRPESLENVKNLPVKYIGQRNCWVNKKIFFEWYTEVFIPEVRKNQTVSGSVKKVLLILDNAPSHCTAEQLNRVDENFQVMFLHPNVTALIQPMAQGVMEKAKRIYKKASIREFLLNRDNSSIYEAVRQQTLKDCCYRMANAWNLLTEQNLKIAWNPVLGRSSALGTINIERHLETVQALNVVQKFSGFENYTFHDILAWLQEDYNETGWEYLTAEEIVDRIQRRSLRGGEVVAENTDIIDVEDSSSSVASQLVPSVEAALKGLQTFRNWFETTWDCQASDILNIQNLRDRALELL